MDLSNWFLFPTSILIATISTSSGIGGAVFFAPLFILVLKLEPTVAVGAALFTEMFGLGSGLTAYIRKKLIDYRLGRDLLWFSIPGALLGVFGAESIPGDVLKGIFGAGIIFIGVQLFRSYQLEHREQADAAIAAQAQKSYESELVSADGTVYRYTVSAQGGGRALAAIGGAFLGMISVGLAELQEYELVVRCRVPSPVAVATSIFTVVITVFFASMGHAYNFATSADGGILTQVVCVVAFTVPGVIIGGQFGPTLQARIDPERMKLFIATLFVLVGLFMLFTLTR